ncbi:hypothetical protein L313_0072 [Acinetobacter haemolyticus CIP 64.3 = MTCC 9819]|uniref:Uncharacterized protein n=1 Tax=Acinetobacter haemolyticus CIP 64.3 = MTCC 9819 TaxID=1217659 RepID=N9G7P9_ACIHA|nr:hypothetical protein [Acinetobacter haemolyticus]ENW15515.1 hypothetical protein F927_03250 [Acinetobacter haemolyticus CIP 64.3 = MTCC 9819]EPR90161.1 hypothetical protein L313_0072 [Acinetobacter haemolyticus CIP 64.3 = MTCC 9819]QXZ26566.1 hypothetical protein I6L22_15595 [Acinetobacter haemolyticus]SPT48762.1 Uncharacterised protein [Acinetobacter haemolyticus]SUU62281.1 Uncharacterised protein [Acinetobacter haemolyticus]
MIGQQRNILAAMGIDVWIPRDVVCQKNTAPSLWRDQIIDQPTQYSEPVQNNDARITQDAPMASVETQPAIVRESSQQVELDEKPVVKDSVIEKEQIVITAPVQAFELQMYVLENCALLVESSQLNDAQRQLWQNIQKARLGQYAELKWPFPLAAFQESRGLSSYIQGFLDATANNKKILCLGQLDFIQHTNILHLASLEEMIVQPLLKRRLWQLMQS